MQLPTAQTPIQKCQELSRYTAAMLARFPENAALTALIPKLTAAMDALSASHQAHEGASSAVIAQRVAVRHADLVADKAVRQTLKAAQTVDGSSKGRVALQLFPSGVTPIVRPIGVAEVTELRDLEGRLDAVASLWPEAKSEKAKIVAARTQYEAALEARRNVVQTISDAAAARDSAREDFLDVYAEVAARVKAEFPRDRAMQDLFFDRVRAEASPDETDSPPAPTPGPAPAPTA